MYHVQTSVFHKTCYELFNENPSSPVDEEKQETKTEGTKKKTASPVDEEKQETKTEGTRRKPARLLMKKNKKQRRQGQRRKPARLLMKKTRNKTAGTRSGQNNITDIGDLFGGLFGDNGINHWTVKYDVWIPADANKISLLDYKKKEEQEQTKLLQKYGVDIEKLKENGMNLEEWIKALMRRPSSLSHSEDLPIPFEKSKAAICHFKRRRFQSFEIF